jgi:UDP-N-acetylglucosamine 2-epimerase (non-hydrolysing)
MLHADLVRAAALRAFDLRGFELVIVQGDTSSALGGAQAAKEAGIALGHVEAGLRSFDPSQPWPEEANRVAIDKLSDLLFAPTIGNAANLRREKLRGTIHVTGNTGVDALAAIAGPLPMPKRRHWLRSRKLRLLVTCHRREIWNGGIEQVALALVALATEGMSIDVMLHPNGTVSETLWRLLGDHPSIRLLPPMSHPAMVRSMGEADLILSDSGGIQEEAPALGVPLLVLREKTERPEAVECGSAELVGVEPERILAAVRRLNHDRRALAAMAIPTLPFGDGRAAGRIASTCISFLSDGAPALRWQRS